MSKKRILVFLLIIIILSLVSNYYPELTGDVTKSTQAEKETGVLTRVVDGDTIHALVNGEDWTIRMLGINTPEKNMPHAGDAKIFLKQFENKTIILVSDKEDTDKYNRKLRYVLYENRNLNTEILELGLANSYYYSGLIYEKELLAAEQQAKNLGLGIWEKSKEKCAFEECLFIKELNAEEEYFILGNKCSFSCVLDGWFVKDAGRNVFYLQNMSEFSEKTYYSKNGTDVWNNNGDRAFIYDKSGFFVLFYEY